MLVLEGTELLIKNLIHQLDSYWTEYNHTSIIECIDEALYSMELNMKDMGSNCKYAFDSEGNVQFSPYNTVAYSVFLYRLSSICNTRGYVKEAGLLYYLNKIMNGVEWFYEVALPVHFWADHPLSCVLGRATYGDYLFVSQGVTVGGNSIGMTEVQYPVIGNNVTLCSRSSVIGDCNIGNNVVISTGSSVRNMDVPSNSIVFGEGKDVIIKAIDADTPVRSLWRQV